MTPSHKRIDDSVVDAIGSLGNPRRLEILLALAEAAHEHQQQWYAMSFTELYDAVDVDSTSQFSYHLGQLVGHFVAEADDGYRLTYGGDKIVRALLSRLYESPDAFGDVDVPGRCVFCETDSLVAALETERFVVRCKSCESSLVTDVFPQSQARGRTPSEIVDSFGYRIWSAQSLLQAGICPECYGRTEASVNAHELDSRTFYTHVSSCPECWFVISMPLEVTAVFHPAAVGFFWEHGISIPDVALWEFFEFIVSDVVRTEVTSLEPLEATVAITLEGETRRFAVGLDETVAVTPY